MVEVAMTAYILLCFIGWQAWRAADHAKDCSQKLTELEIALKRIVEPLAEIASEFGPLGTMRDIGRAVERMSQMK